MQHPELTPCTLGYCSGASDIETTNADVRATPAPRSKCRCVCWALLCAALVLVALLLLASTDDRLGDVLLLSRRKCFIYSWEQPTLCPQGKDHWSAEQLRLALPAFAKLYKQRPIYRNSGGMNANHAFALWFTARSLKVKHIIESGVNRGQSTWLLRQAAGSDVWIYSLDPHKQDFLNFRDNLGNTTYFMGADFRDLGSMNWSSLIPAEERSQTLVVLDDHMSSTKRVRQLLSLGFVHLWYDDNWKKNSDCYSFNWVCSPLPTGIDRVPYKDNFGRLSTNITVSEHIANLQYLSKHMDIYFEFPPLFDGCHWDDNGALIRHGQLQELGLPSLSEDRNNYLHFHPPYVRLRP